MWETQNPEMQQGHVTEEMPVFLMDGKDKNNRERERETNFSESPPPSKASAMKPVLIIVFLKNEVEKLYVTKSLVSSGG